MWTKRETNNIIKTRSKLWWSTTAFYFISGIITATWASRIPDVQQKFALSDATLGLVLFSLSAGLIMGLSIASWLVEKFGATRVMNLTTIGYLILLCLLAAAPSVIILVISLFLFGICRNITNLANNINAVKVQLIYKKPVMATFHGIWSFACLGGAIIGTFFIRNNLSPLTHFFIVSTISLLIILAFKRRIEKNDNNQTKKKPFFIKPDKYLLVLGLIALCGMMCESTLFDWSVNYYVKVVQAEQAYRTFGYAAFIISMTLGRLLGDKFIALYGPVKLLMVNGLLVAVGFIIVSVFPHIIITTAGFLMIGLGISIIVPMVFVLAAQSATMPASYAIASVTLIGYVGFLSGPLLVGSISQLFNMQVSFAMVGIFGLGIFILARVLQNQIKIDNAIAHAY